MNHAVVPFSFKQVLDRRDLRPNKEYYVLIPTDKHQQLHRAMWVTMFEEFQLGTGKVKFSEVSAVYEGGVVFEKMAEADKLIEVKETSQLPSSLRLDKVKITELVVNREYIAVSIYGRNIHTYLVTWNGTAFSGTDFANNKLFAYFGAIYQLPVFQYPPPGIGDALSILQTVLKEDTKAWTNKIELSMANLATVFIDPGAGPVGINIITSPGESSDETRIVVLINGEFFGGYTDPVSLRLGFQDLLKRIVFLQSAQRQYPVPTKSV